MILTPHYPSSSSQACSKKCSLQLLVRKEKQRQMSCLHCWLSGLAGWLICHSQHTGLSWHRSTEYWQTDTRRQTWTGRQPGPGRETDGQAPADRETLADIQALADRQTLTDRQTWVDRYWQTYSLSVCLTFTRNQAHVVSQWWCIIYPSWEIWTTDTLKQRQRLATTHWLTDTDRQNNVY